MMIFRGSLEFVTGQVSRFRSTHRITRLVRKNKDWYLTVEFKNV
jgi:hypothetical protein